MRLTFETLRLRTRHDFRISHGAHREYRNLLVKIEHEGITGLGEASASHYYGETPELIEQAVRTWLPVLGDDPFALDAISGRMTRTLGGHGAARAAIETALHDWIGQRLGQPVWRLFGLDPGRVPVSCVTLGLAPPAEMEAKLEEVRDFPRIKVKLGAPGDVENLKRIRAGFGGALQVDANTAWTAADAVRVLRAIEPLGIELVEQPVAREDLAGLAWVRERTAIPVFADEACHRAADIPHLVGRVDGVNLKLMKTGGLAEMRRAIHVAKAHGLQVMLGSMVETSLALSAAAQLAPLADVLDLDGHWLLDHDPFRGAPGERGEIRLSPRPGLGVEPVAALAR